MVLATYIFALASLSFRIKDRDNSVATSLADFRLAREIIDFKTASLLRTAGWMGLLSLLVMISLGFIIWKTLNASERARGLLAQSAVETNKARLAAEAASNTKSAFLAHMSHEIRTPLTAIMGYAELLQHSQLSENERKESLDAVLRNGHNLVHLLDDILDLSKVEAGQLRITRANFDLVECMEDSLKPLHRKSREKNLLLAMDFGSLAPITLRTDPIRLQQILVNLVANAIKFTSNGSVTIRVEYKRNSPEDSQLWIDVIDTGIGISPERADQLFQRFSQLDDSVARKHGGAGIGLNLSRHLAKLLGGDLLLLESTPDLGSRFRLILKGVFSTVSAVSAVSAVANLNPKETNSAWPQFSDQPLAGLFVLVVDDAADNQFIIKKILNFAGAEVHLASNGVEAVDSVIQNEPDLVLMDIQMPIMNGFEATSKIRSQGFKIPIVALTAHAMKEERERCLASGFDEHLSKPIDKIRLVQCVANLTGTLARQGKFTFSENLTHS